MRLTVVPEIVMLAIVARMRSVLSSKFKSRLKSKENTKRREREQDERARARNFMGNCCFQVLTVQSQRGRIEERQR